MNQYTILVDTQDSKGLVYEISQAFYEANVNITSNNEFVDKENAKFFMRTQVEGELDAQKLQQGLQDKLGKEANITIATPTKKNIVLMVTKELHCLGDILMRHESNELNANILAVIGNYPDLEKTVSKFDIPYFTVSHEGHNRASHEQEILKVLEQFKAELDYIVLAKYMRILTPEFVEQFENKIINIHHSFLPAFIGANPYKQAFDRGVKIIGATAHFVNNNLDEGPIIMQDIIHVDHTYSWREMQSAGRDVEKIVLSNALRHVFEDRVFVYANKTVIL